MKRFVLTIVAATTALAVSGCTRTLPPLKIYDDASHSTSQIAIVESQGEGMVVVDYIDSEVSRLYLRRRDNPEHASMEIHLDPGTYVVSYFGNSMLGSYGEASTVELLAGHKYRPGHSTCLYFCARKDVGGLWSNPVTYLWFEDVTTGQVISGSKAEPATNLVNRSMQDD